MTYSQTLLKELKTAKNLSSDNQAAMLIGCTRQFISKINKGIKNFGPDSVIYIADLTGKDPKKAVIERLLEDAENPKVRQTFEEIKQQIQ